MKKLFMVLCFGIMFFGIVGCPSSDDPTITSSKTSFSSTTSTSTPATSDVSDPDVGGIHIPEPATLLLIGSGLVGLGVLGRKRFKKQVGMNHTLPDNGGRRLGIDRRQFSYYAHIPERRSGKDRRSGLDRRLKPRTSK